MPVLAHRAPTRLTFPTAGVFQYVCALHQFLGQRGVIAVGQPLPSAAAGRIARRRPPPPRRRRRLTRGCQRHPAIGLTGLAGSDAGQSSYTPARDPHRPRRPLCHAPARGWLAARRHRGGRRRRVRGQVPGRRPGHRRAHRGGRGRLHRAAAGAARCRRSCSSTWRPTSARRSPTRRIRELLERSPGRNAGLRFLPHALPYRPGVSDPPDADDALRPSSGSTRW